MVRILDTLGMPVVLGLLVGAAALTFDSAQAAEAANIAAGTLAAVPAVDAGPQPGIVPGWGLVTVFAILVGFPAK